MLRTRRSANSAESSSSRIFSEVFFCLIPAASTSSMELFMPWSLKAPISSRIWSRSMGASGKQPVVAAAVGNRGQPEDRKLWGRIACRRRYPIVLPGQQAQDHVLADGAGGDRGTAGVGNIFQPVGENGAEDADELAVAVDMASEDLPRRL